MEGAVQERWEGPATPVTAPLHEGGQALRWAAEGSIATSHIPHDWTDFDRLEMWMHSAEAGNAVIALVLVSDREDTLPEDYFITHIPIDWEGWRKLELPFRGFRRVGTPAGSGKIDSIAFHATGWQTVQRPGTVLTIDAITLGARAPGEDLVISDMEEDIDAWNGLFPEVGFVKEGQQSGAWLDTVAQTSVRTENVPPDWRDYEYLCFWMHSQVANDADIVLLVYSDNPATDGDDYWKALLRINWQGWQHIAAPLGGLDVHRQPSWDNVTGLRFAAGGWGVEPAADTELRIDDVRLTNAAPEGTLPEPGLIDDFEGPLHLWETEMVLDADRPHSGRFCGRWTDLAKYPEVALGWEAVRDWSGYERIELWARAEGPQPPRFDIKVYSDNEETAARDYWRSGTLTVPVGEWERLTVPLSYMRKRGSPRGWDKVDGLELAPRGSTGRAGGEIWIDDVRVCKPALQLGDEGIHRLGPDSVRWEVRLANRGEDVIVVRLQLEQPPVAGLTLRAPEPSTISLEPGAEEVVAVQATLSDDLLREPQQLSRQRVTLTAVPVVGAESADVTCPALALYLGYLEPHAHPHLFFGAEDVPALRDVLTEPGAARRADSYTKEADGALTQVTRGLGRLGRDLEGAAFLYRMTGRRQYLSSAKRAINRILGEPTWVDARHRDKPPALLMGNTARALACAYDWLHDELSDEVRAAMSHAVIERAIQPLIDVIDSGIEYPGTRRNHNWYGILHGGTGVAALALLGEDPRAAAWVARVCEQVERMLDAAPLDGGWSEGPGYWEYGFVPVFQFMDALRRTTNGTIDLFEHPFCQQTGAFGVYTRLSGFDSVNFGDSGRKPWDASLLLKLAAELKSPELQWAALNRRTAALHPFTFIWYDPDVAAEPPADWPRSKQFRGIDWVFLRSGWGRDATVLALRSGRRDDHSHLDANSFGLEAFGQPMIVDVGRGSYGPAYFDKNTRWNDPATRTESHNTILINGANQIPGEDGGHIAKFSTSEAFDYTLAEATVTYEGAKKVLRHVLFVRPAYFVIYDEVDTEEPCEVAFSLYKDRSDSKRELEDGSVVYDWKKGSLLVKALRPTSAALEPAAEVKQYRCDRITHPGRTSKCHFLVVLYPLPPGYDRPLPSISATPEGQDIVVHVKRPGATDTIRIRPTQPAATIEAQSSRHGRAFSFRSPAETIQRQS